MIAHTAGYGPVPVLACLSAREGKGVAEVAADRAKRIAERFIVAGIEASQSRAKRVAATNCAQHC